MQPNTKELPMVEVIERETVNEAIEATVNYVLDNGEKIFTQTAAPGATDVRSGGALDPRRVTIRNARLQTEPFVLDRNGFRFVSHDTKVTDFYDEDEIRRVYYPEMEALVKAESGASRVVVFDHTLRTADDEQRGGRKIRARLYEKYPQYPDDAAIGAADAPLSALRSRTVPTNDCSAAMTRSSPSIPPRPTRTCRTGTATTASRRSRTRPRSPCSAAARRLTSGW